MINSGEQDYKMIFVFFRSFDFVKFPQICMFLQICVMFNM